MKRRPADLSPLTLWIIVLTAMFVCSGGCSRPISELDAATCYRFEFQPKPRWVLSGALSREGESFLLTESLFNNLLLYSSYSPITGRIQGRSFLANGVSQVVRIRRSANGFIFQTRDGELVWFDESWGASGALKIEHIASSEAGSVRSIFDWVQFGNNILVYGALESLDGSFSTGFISLPISRPEDFILLAGGEGDTNINKYYQIGNSYLTSLEEKAYFLMLGDIPYIGEVQEEEGGVKRYREVAKIRLPDNLLPILPDLSGPSSAEGLYGAIEKMSLPVGLIGNNNKLFVLLRRPASGQTTWALNQLNPGTGDRISERILPVVSNHLLVIPGNNHWLLLEKGPVEGFGVQDLSRVTLVPNSWVEGTQDIIDCGN